MKRKCGVIVEYPVVSKANATESSVFGALQNKIDFFEKKRKNALTLRGCSDYKPLIERGNAPLAPNALADNNQ